MIQNHYDKYNLWEKLNDYDGYFKLLYDFMDLHYDNFTEIFLKIGEKYGNDITYKDYSHIIEWTEWFLENKEKNVELDKKHNSN